jgi:ABC-type glycerol-3-phosphate transport system substrate-binding protein
MRRPSAPPILNRFLRTCVSAALAAGSLASCGGGGERRATIWTDAPELALAAELFNARGGSAAVLVEYKRDPAESLAGSAGAPALLVGRGLTGERLRGRLSGTDFLLGGALDRSAFYPGLLDGGMVGGKRLLLPLSFNLPAVAFRRDSPAKGDGFTLSLADLADPTLAFRDFGNGQRMGFSPRWDPRFLVAALDAGGARFREGGDRKRYGAEELSWDSKGLETALEELGAWSARVGGSAALEDDYRFKHLYSTPYRWLKEGRALYAYMDSSELFLLGEEKLAELDFRWFSSGGKIPASEGALYAGLVSGAPGRRAAESFLRWLLSPEAQRALLERSRASGVSAYSFGMLGGFSSLRSVNEGMLPPLYPALVGHAPPPEGIAPPPRLPPDWPAIRDSVLVPWVLEATARGTGVPRGDPGTELAARISDFRMRAERR